MKTKEQAKKETFKIAINLPIMKRIEKAIEKEIAKGGYILDFKVKQRANQSDKNFQYQNNIIYHTLVMLGYSVRLDFNYNMNSNKKCYVIVIDWHDEIIIEDSED